MDPLLLPLLTGCQDSDALSLFVVLLTAIAFLPRSCVSMVPGATTGSVLGLGSCCCWRGLVLCVHCLHCCCLFSAQSGGRVVDAGSSIGHAKPSVCDFLAPDSQTQLHPLEQHAWGELRPPAGVAGYPWRRSSLCDPADLHLHGLPHQRLCFCTVPWTCCVKTHRCLLET